MPSDVLGKLSNLVHGKFEDIRNLDNEDETVDATVLGELIDDTYTHTGKPTAEVSERLLKTIEQYDDSSDSKKQATLRSFAVFIERRIERLKTIFQRLDKDDDERITLDDIFNYLDEHKLKYDRRKVESVYNVVDRNHDGAVTYDEFIQQLLLVPSYGRNKDERFFYRAYDFFVEDLEISADSDVVMSKELHNGWGYFYAGGIAGVVSRTCTAPFDRLKVYLITNSTRHSPLSFMEALKSIYYGGNPPGIRAFFTGNGLNIVKVLPESAMKFGGFESAKRLLAQIEGVDDMANLSGVSTFLAGGIGGMVSQLCVYPIDTVKFRVQSAASGKPGEHGVLFTVLSNMIKEGGLTPFYRGLYVGVLGIFPFAALDLGIFSAFKAAYIKSEARRLHVDNSEVQLGNLAVLSMGAVSGSFGASVVYPVNLVRTRIQIQGTPAHPFVYNGFIDCYRQTIKREGWRGLFRGLVPNLAKVAPSVSISYLVYERTKRVMGLP